MAISASLSCNVDVLTHFDVVVMQLRRADRRARPEAGGFLQNVYTSRTESLFRASKGVDFKLDFNVDFKLDFKSILRSILGRF